MTAATITRTSTTTNRMNVARTEKRCPDCKRTLPRGMFKPRGKKNDVRFPVCNDCLPVFQARRAEIQRQSQAERMRKRNSGEPVDQEYVPQLPTEPIRRWLIQDLGVPSIEAMRDLTPEEKGRVREVAEWLGVNDRQIHRWRSGETDKTSMDDFDRALCHAGVPWMLRELFPELFRFPEKPECDWDVAA